MNTVDEFVTEACQQRLENWRSKALHGEFLKKVDNGGELGLSFNWLIKGRLKMPTEAQTVAAQDQVLPVRAVQSHIYGMPVSVNCRVCGMVPEYVDHVLSSCTPLAATMYKQRHDRVASIVHWSLLKSYNLSVSRNYWDTTPAVVESPDVKVLWDFTIFTDHHLAARRPDIVVINKQTKTAQIIDVAVPADKNVSMKEKEKIDS